MLRMLLSVIVINFIPSEDSDGANSKFKVYYLLSFHDFMRVQKLQFDQLDNYCALIRIFIVPIFEENGICMLGVVFSRVMNAVKRS